MAGHNKWTQIKRKKGITDAKRSQMFSKLTRLISLESKKANGDSTAPGLRTVIEKARSFNMPNENIDRAVKKGVGGTGEDLEAITYEAYAPGGVALIIEALTGNRNKAASEIKHILSIHDGVLGGKGSSAWAFKKTAEGWMPESSVETDETTRGKLEKLLEALEDNDEVENVYTNLSNNR